MKKSPAQSAPECYETLRRILIEIDDADDTGRVAALDNIYGIAKAAYSAAPAQEPVAWAWFHRGQVNFDGSDALRELDDLKATPIPLYAAPPQDEARELLVEIMAWDGEVWGEVLAKIHAYLEENK